MPALDRTDGQGVGLKILAGQGGMAQTGPAGSLVGEGAGRMAGHRRVFAAVGVTENVRMITRSYPCRKVMAKAP